MKRIERFLFNFNSAYFYTFVAGILVSLAANLFTTALLTEDPKICVHIVDASAFTLLVSSIGAFGVSALLENARSEWECSNRQSDPEVKRDFIDKRIPLIWVSFAVIFIGLIVSIFLLLR